MRKKSNKKRFKFRWVHLVLWWFVLMTAILSIIVFPIRETNAYEEYYMRDDCGNSMVWALYNVGWPSNAYMCPQWFYYYTPDCYRNEYVITRKNRDGTVLKTGNCFYGWYPNYIGELPTKDNIWDISCAFSWWDSYSVINWNKTYTAKFFCGVTVTYMSWDAILWSQEINYWEKITNPEILSEWQNISWAYIDSEQTIPFDLSNETITWDITLYVVLWCETPYYEEWWICKLPTYQIDWLNRDWTTIKSDSVKYGQYPNYTWDIPTRSDDGCHTYDFKWWPTIPKATQDASYTAQYYQYNKTFNIIYKDWEDEIERDSANCGTYWLRDYVEKSWYVFEWRYLDNDFTENLWDSLEVNWDIVIYAKREACLDWYVVKNNVCVPWNIWISYEEGNIEYIDTNWKVFTWIWTIKFDDWEKTITMLDRNLWADEYINIDDNNDNDMLLRSSWFGTDNLGYYFQWWNNYWFTKSWIKTWEDQIDTTWYWWNNPYVSDTFIVWNENRAISNNNGNLWWWELDIRDNVWNTSKSKDYMRQWPCPAGYHVPSGWEWIDLFTAWAESKGYTLSVSDKLALDTKTHPEYIEFLEEFKIPYAWRLDYSDATYNNHDNNFVYLRSSSPYEENSPYSRRLLAWPRAKSTSQRMRANWYPIRCFADNYDITDDVYTLNYNTRWWTKIQSQTILLWEKWYLPWYSTIRENAEISGWYDINFRELNLDWNVFTNLILWEDISDWNKNVYIQVRRSDDYLVKFIDYNWNILKQEFIKDWNNAVAPNNPQREWYVFDWWDKNLLWITQDTEFIAQYTKKQYSNWWGGGWSSLKKDNCPDWDYSDSYYDWICWMPENDAENNREWDVENDKIWHNSANEFEFDTLKFNPYYSDEMNQAYQFAYHYWITTKNNIRDAAMNWHLTRIAMAKMLSQYAINVLWKTPDTTRQNKFNDISEKLDSEYDDWVTLAYQLWIMWINMPWNNFRPYWYVTRAEFATALSRLLYNTPDWEYEWTSEYYTNHMNKLSQEKIITVTDQTIKELRGYVMLMLMRSAK